MTSRYVRVARLIAAAAATAAVAAVGGPAAGASTGLLGPDLTEAVQVCPVPTINAVATPDGQHAGRPGTTVVITGTGLAGGVCTTSVMLGGSAVTPATVSPGQVTFAMPAGTDGGAVQVSVGDAPGQANTSNHNYDFVAQPTVNGLSDPSPTEGSSLTAGGQALGMGALPGRSVAVSYCGSSPSPAQFVSDTQVQLTAPSFFCEGATQLTFSAPYNTSPGATDAPIVVTVAAGRIAITPSVVSVSPSGSLAPGEEVAVTGSGFGPAGQASIGGSPASSTWSDSEVDLRVPAGARSGVLQLVREDGATVLSQSVTVAPSAAGGGAAASGGAGRPAGGGSTVAGSGVGAQLPPAAASGAVPGAPSLVGTASAGDLSTSRAATGSAAPAPRSSRPRCTYGPFARAIAGPVMQAPVQPGCQKTPVYVVHGAPSAGRSQGTAGTYPSDYGTSPTVSAVTRMAPLPWVTLGALFLAAVLLTEGAELRRWLPTTRLGRLFRMEPISPAQPPAPSEMAWRMSGYATALALVVVYLVTAVGVLMTALTDWLPGASAATLPGAGVYRAVAVLLSAVLTAIAARYGYYYWCWAGSRRHFAPARPLDPAVLAARRLPHMKFQVTTRGGALEIVERTVQAVVHAAELHPWLAPHMSVEVITESADEAGYLPVRFASAPVRVDALCLPRSYTTPNGTGLKARALHYMVERRLAGYNRVAGRSFIVHLDEETLVHPDHLLVLVDYLSSDPRPVSQGPILYPLEWDKAPWLCRAMESLRPFGCSECARVMSNPPPPHLHGSNLVVDEDVENRIGWDFGTIDGQPYIAEDLLFGLRAYALLGREGFGWHGATMLEQPPLSVYWAVQQRLRWVLGALQGWRAMGRRDDLRSMPGRERRRLRLAVGFRVATYALGFPVGFAGLFFFLHPATRQAAVASPLGLWRVLIMLAGVGWVASYQIGLARNLRYQNLSRTARLRQHLILLVLTPVTGLFETAGPFLALTRWLMGARQARWTPTPKTAESPSEPVRVPVMVPVPAENTPAVG